MACPATQGPHGWVHAAKTRQPARAVALKSGVLWADGPKSKSSQSQALGLPARPLPLRCVPRVSVRVHTHTTHYTLLIWKTNTHFGEEQEVTLHHKCLSTH